MLFGRAAKSMPGSSAHMPIELKMPALSPTMEEGRSPSGWSRKATPVAAGDLLAEIETDKATMEFEAVDEGTIARILVAEGTDEVKVGTVIALIAEEGEDAGAAASAPAAAQEPLKRPAAKPAPASRPRPLPRPM
jgi:pyruvate dehydrogenase E2 component (dihydrolipoamide acetyltransferase)